MTFKTSQTAVRIAIGIFLGAELFLGLNITMAQSVGYNCVPNQNGNGWICENLAPGQSSGTTDGSDRYNSSSAVLSGEPDLSEPSDSRQINQTENPLSPVDNSGGIAQEINSPNEPHTPSPLSTPQEDKTSIQDRELVSNRIPSRLDWVPKSELSVEQRSALPGNCCGTYVDPLVHLSPIENEPDTLETTFVSDSGLSQLTQSLISIEGNVRVKQGNRYIFNDTNTSIDQESDVVLMDGNIIFREPGILMLGSSAYIDSENSVNRIEDAQYALHNYGAHGNANSIVYTADSGLVSIDNGEFSRCEPGDTFWKLRADNIILDQTANRGFAKNVSLRIGNTPIFYYPGTLPFPLGDERISGFLAPSTGSTRSGGFDFELPYYFNLAPNYDATLYPRIISDLSLIHI